MISLLAEFIFTHEWSTLTDEKKQTRLQLTNRRTEQLFLDLSSSSDSSVSVVEQTPSPLRRTNRANAGKRIQPPPTCSDGKMYKQVLRLLLRCDS